LEVSVTFPEIEDGSSVVEPPVGESLGAGLLLGDSLGESLGAGLAVDGGGVGGSVGGRVGGIVGGEVGLAIGGQKLIELTAPDLLSLRLTCFTLGLLIENA
jgi:hypothetical protein